MNHVKYFKANPKVVHSVSAFFKYVFIVMNVSIFIKINTMNFNEIYSKVNDSTGFNPSIIPPLN